MPGGVHSSLAPSPARVWPVLLSGPPFHDVVLRDDHACSFHLSRAKQRWAVLFVDLRCHCPESSLAWDCLHRSAAGAGFLHPSKHEEIRVLLQSAINTALRQGGSIDEAVVIALSVLESSPLTNAALGSCLTEDGRVECEASIVMGNGAMGSVGAATGVDHAIQVAHRLARERNDDGLIKELGRVRPISLVGEGVYRYAQQCGLAVAARDQLDQHNTTPQTKAIWRHYKDMIDRHATKRQQRGDQKRSGLSLVEPTKDERLEPQGGSPSSTPDTVGAIACDYMGRMCAGTSSGGIWMKPMGRLGSSAVPGAGCYAVNGDHAHRHGNEREATIEASAATCVSGCGEDIMEQFMAMRCCDMMRHSRDAAYPTDASSRDLDHGVSTPTNASMVMHDITRSLMVKEQALPASMASTKKREKERLGKPRHAGGGRRSLHRHHRVEGVGASAWAGIGIALHLGAHRTSLCDRIRCR